MPNEYLVTATREAGKPVSWCYDTKRQAFKAFDKMKATGEMVDGGGTIISAMVFDANNNIIGRWHRNHPEA